jgi:RNase P/RNase MRP subunit POP5
MPANAATEDDLWSYILIEGKPIVSDPRELQTIVQFSLRSLFGEFEQHSVGMQVVENSGRQAIIKCQTNSVAFIRAALTCCTPPTYLESTHYRFDVLQISQQRKNLLSNA